MKGAYWDVGELGDMVTPDAMDMTERDRMRDRIEPGRADRGGSSCGGVGGREVICSAAADVYAG